MPVHCQHLELAHSLPSMSQFFISGDQNFSFSISTVNEQSGLISFRIDLFDLLAVQGTLKRILQHQSSKTSFFGAQLSLCSNSHTHTHPYMTSGKLSWNSTLRKRRSWLLRPWDFPGKTTGVGCRFLLQGIFLTQGSKPGPPYCRQTLLPSEPPGKSLVSSLHGK